MTELDGRVIIMTGAANGLGRAMALGLLAQGAHVLAADLADMAGLAALAAGAGAGAGAAGRLHCVRGDVAEPADAQAMVDAALAAFGRIDGLVNNAALGMNGITDKVISDPKPFWEVTPEQWAPVIRVNVNGPFMMARAFVRAMLARGRGGKIVNILTGRPTMVAAGFSPYGPSKAAMEAATAIWAKDLAGAGITVNGLNPGAPADTAMIPQGDVDRASLARPEIMVPPICWLMSAASDGITSRRFLATEWQDGLTPAEVAKTLAHEAGW